MTCILVTSPPQPCRGNWTFVQIVQLSISDLHQGKKTAGYKCICPVFVIDIKPLFGGQFLLQLLVVGWEKVNDTIELIFILYTNIDNIKLYVTKYFIRFKSTVVKLLLRYPPKESLQIYLKLGETSQTFKEKNAKIYK